jgi:type IV pilus assembly protein PilA
MRIQDKLISLRNKRGFTLVELMIVVAIIGVLAALAIYGVRKYLTNAKSAEARTSIGRIAKDSQVAYERENMDSAILALKGNVDIAHTLCPAGAVIPTNAGDIQNKKYQSDPGEWNGAGWNCLKFSMSDPQYFQYEFTSDGTGVENAVFEAQAHGDLDGDGSMSTFGLGGKIQKSPSSGEMVLTLAPTIREDAAEE